jgi:hypothetical protein
VLTEGRVLDITVAVDARARTLVTVRAESQSQSEWPCGVEPTIETLRGFDSGPLADSSYAGIFSADGSAPREIAPRRFASSARSW